MAISRVRVVTTNADSYIRKVGQHWSHRYPVAFHPADTCTIQLPHAVCVLHATREWLDAEVTTDPAEDQGRMEAVVEEHVKRFGFREELAFPWEREA